MLTQTSLPIGIVEATRKDYTPLAMKHAINGVDEVQYLEISEWTKIKKHGHDDQWEIWMLPEKSEAFVCLKGEEHEFINNSAIPRKVVAIKGHDDISYEELESFLWAMGFSVCHGSVMLE